MKTLAGENFGIRQAKLQLAKKIGKFKLIASYFWTLQGIGGENFGEFVANREFFPAKVSIYMV